VCRICDIHKLEDLTNLFGGCLGAFIASGGEPSVGANITDITYRIQGWNFVHGQPPDLSRGLLYLVCYCCIIASWTAQIFTHLLLCTVVAYILVRVLIVWKCIMQLHWWCNNGHLSPSPPVDNIWAMKVVWRWEGRLSELFCVVLCTEIVHGHKHT